MHTYVHFHLIFISIHLFDIWRQSTDIRLDTIQIISNTTSILLSTTNYHSFLYYERYKYRYNVISTF